MNRREHILNKIAEEGVEVAQRATKALSFGLDEIQEGQGLDNRERLLGEFADLCGVLEMLNEGCIIEEVVKGLRPQIDAKKAKVEKYLLYSAELGLLDGKA